MAQTQKKFLDSGGTSYLWQKIAAELAKKGQVNTVSASDNTIVVGGTAMAPTLAVKISQKTGNSLTVETGHGEEGLYVSAPTSVVYSIQKDATAGEGFSATYHLTADGVQTGTAINIPKDMVVSSGSVETKATTGAWGEAGTYLHLVLANSDSSDIYINVSDLIEYVSSGSTVGDMLMINIDSQHRITATITDGTITKAKLVSSVQTSLGLADSALQPSDITEGTTNGTIMVGATPVAVHGLGTAAFAATTAFDAAGAADDVYTAIVSLSNSDIDTAIASATTNS